MVVFAGGCFVRWREAGHGLSGSGAREGGLFDAEALSFFGSRSVETLRAGKKALLLIWSYSAVQVIVLTRP